MSKKKPNFFEKIGLALGILKREVSVLVLGLDNSGKSTLLTHLKPKKGDITEVAPTVGFSVEGFKMGGMCSHMYLVFLVFARCGRESVCCGALLFSPVFALLQD